MLKRKENELSNDSNFIQLTMLVFSMSAVIREMSDRIDKLENNNTENSSIIDGFYKYSRN